MLLRASNAVGYTNYPDNVVRYFVAQARRRRHRPLPRLRLAQLGREHARRDGRGAASRARSCEAAICYTGDLTDPRATKYDLAYYVRMAKELEAAGAHILGIKDMAGLCKPEAARMLVGRCARRSASRSTSTPTTPRHRRAASRAGRGRGRAWTPPTPRSTR